MAAALMNSQDLWLLHKTCQNSIMGGGRAHVAQPLPNQLEAVHGWREWGTIVLSVVATGKLPLLQLLSPRLKRNPN